MRFNSSSTKEIQKGRSINFPSLESENENENRRTWAILSATSFPESHLIDYEPKNMLRFQIFTSNMDYSDAEMFSLIIAFSKDGRLRIIGLSSNSFDAPFVFRKNGRFPCKVFQKLFALSMDEDEEKAGSRE